MEWASTWLGMANTALSRINKQILQTLDDGSTSALLCNQLITECTKNILNQYDWHSARKRAMIAPQLQKPEFGYRNRFVFPGDYIRLYKVHSSLPWTREGNAILSDENTLSITYIAYPKTPDTLDPLIVDAITTMLAEELAVSLTADSSLVNLLYQETEMKLEKAKRQEDAGEEDMKPDLHSWSREAGMGISGTPGYQRKNAAFLRQLFGERS